MIRALDICAGAGGWACAARGLPIEIVAAVERWDTAAKTYKLNSPGTEVYRMDLRDPRTRERLLEDWAGRIDLVLGGIPCEWLSQARVKKTPETDIEEGRRTLDACLSLVKELDPRWWCLEDVKGLARELPIFTPWIEVDAARYSPQVRKRIYVGEFPPPAPRADAQVLASALRPGPYRIGKRAFDRVPTRNHTYTAQTTYGLDRERKGPTVTNHTSRVDARMVVLAPDLPGGKRQCEWQELARLQGFPEDFLFYGSPTDVGKMVGQAIQIDTGRAILEGIVEEWARQPAPAEEAPCSA